MGQVKKNGKKCEKIEKRAERGHEMIENRVVFSEQWHEMRISRQV
jgi:hypothetical protein